MKPTTMMILMTTIFAACHTAPATHTQTTTAELAARRAQLIAWLHDYTEAGQYPTDEAGMPQSVFVDAHGVRCPMAELIWRSGHPELVEAVAREHNAVRLAEVTEGPLHDWMVGSGLTAEEISLVQGAMDVSMQWMNKELRESTLANGGRLFVEPDGTVVAQAEVRGRLETAERALQVGTAHSLDVATAHLPNGKLPAVAVKGKVIPKRALQSGPQFSRVQSPVAVRTTAASPQMSGTSR